jgi:hypothetical protein
VKTIKSFSAWTNISEATLNDSKEGVVYTISREGRKKIKNISPTISEDLIFEPVETQPEDDDLIIHIRPSTFSEVTYGDLKKYYKIEDPLRQLFIYETTSPLHPFAVAVKGLQTNMIIQKFREAGSARGDYFRETAFVITLAIRLWEKFRLKIPIASNRGVIQMKYTEVGAFLNPPRAEFRNKYYEFMERPFIGEAMIKQCDSLIARLGESVRNIKTIQKNSKDLAINKFFRIALTKEREKISFNSSNYHFIPEKLALAKWNPSDIWISFGECSWMLSSKIERVEERFKRLGIHNLEELNEFLSNSITECSGIIGVSLKQQLIDPGKVYDINVDKNKRFVHDYQTYRTSSRSKSVSLIFGYSISELGKLVSGPIGKGEIDVRTFSSGKRDAISMEVKGSKKSDHVSGKAGSYIRYIMPPEDYAILNYIQREEESSAIEKWIRQNYKFFRPDLEKVFYDDCKVTKSNTTNSRLQAVYFTDWLESLQDEDLQDEIISDIVRFAKSESNWSGAHLLLK